jgi:hypothetical protein
VLDDFGGREGIAAAAGLGGAGGQRLCGGRAGEGDQGEGDSEDWCAHPRIIARIVKIQATACGKPR